MESEPVYVSRLRPFRNCSPPRAHAIQATGLDMFRGLAVILIVWFGVKSALSAAHGHGGGSTSPSSPT